MPPKYYIPESRFNDDLRRQLADTHATNAAMNDPAAFAVRRQATLNAERDFQRRMRGDFQQTAALQRELQGTYGQRAEEARALQGTWDQRARQERDVQGTWDQRAEETRALQGTFPEREEGLDRRQRALLDAEMERTRMSEEGANWRRAYEPTHYGQEISLDDQGNAIHRTIPYQYGQRIDQQGEANPILPQVAPKGFKDVSHLLKAYDSLPEDQRSQFLTETGAQYPDLYKQARNEMAKRMKAGAGPNPTMPTAPTAPSPSAPSPPALPEPPRSTAFSGARVRRDIETPYYPPVTAGGDINALTFREPSAPTYSPPDTTSYVTQGGPEQNLQPGASIPSFNTGIRHSMPTPAEYGEGIRRPIPSFPEPEMTQVPAAVPVQPEAPQAYLPRRSRNVIASLQSQMNEPSLLDRSRWKKPRSSLIVG